MLTSVHEDCKDRPSVIKSPQTRQAHALPGTYAQMATPEVLFGLGGRRSVIDVGICKCAREKLRCVSRLASLVDPSDPYLLQRTTTPTRLNTS